MNYTGYNIEGIEQIVIVTMEGFNYLEAAKTVVGVYGSS